MKPTRFRACACPGTPHTDGDTVTFRERLPFQANVDALAAMFGGEGDDVLPARAMPVYLHAGPIAWNLVDEEGEPVPLNRTALDALPFEDQYEIGDAADTLYKDVILAPLVRRMKTSSVTGPTTNGSPTSGPPSSKRRARSGPSSSPSSDTSPRTSATS